MGLDVVIRNPKKTAPSSRRDSKNRQLWFGIGDHCWRDRKPV